MILLVRKERPEPRPSAHLPTADNRPACRTPLKLELWEPREIADPSRYHICRRCQQLALHERALGETN